MPVSFDKKEYWHNRFISETSFEWLVESAEVIALLEPYLSELNLEARILHLGFGTSDLQCHLRERGFLNINNVDYEPLAIERGRHLEQMSFGDVKMKYAVQDATQLDLAEKYDLVIDKSTLDAVCCGGQERFRRMVKGVYDCLADGGVWISLSYSASRFEVEGLPFDVEIMAKFPTLKLKETDPDVYHWCYMLRPSRDQGMRGGWGQ